MGGWLFLRICRVLLIVGVRQLSLGLRGVVDISTMRVLLAVGLSCPTVPAVTTVVTNGE